MDSKIASIAIYDVLGNLCYRGNFSILYVTHFYEKSDILIAYLLCNFP